MFIHDKTTGARSDLCQNGVMRGEHLTIAALTVGAFFLLCGYEFVRSVSTSLFI